LIVSLPENDESTSSLDTLLKRWNAEPTIRENVVEWRTLPARQPRFFSLPHGLHQALVAALNKSGITRLYTHQSLAWECIQSGKHPVIVTGTASGKTLCFDLPVLDTLLKDPQARAIYLYPTKALAQDQLSAIKDLLSAISDQPTHLAPSPLPLPSSSALPYPSFPISPAIYDGDTSQSARPAIRSKARLVLTNPDMLHTGILPHHTAWAEFFRSLRFVIIDEMHIYRGVFGSHVANVIRRLKRVAQFYGASPQFILTSATIANPQELANKLTEVPVSLIDEDGSARGPKTFLIYNPPIIDHELGIRASLLKESVRLANDLLSHQVQTILFARTRRTVELILRYLRDSVSLDTESANAQVRGYRSGYLPRQRREIERGLRQGQVRLVVATTALELGIDIGQMGAALLAGYPGTIASTWQQAGRAGRGQLPSLSILVTSSSPLDQYLASHPEYFFGKSPELGLINPDNLLILLGHLRCAAFELPFQAKDGFGNLPPVKVKEFLDFLVQEHTLHQSGSKYYWMADNYPAQAISLRSASAETITLQTEIDGSVISIGSVDSPSASFLIHPGAVYMHEAQTFLVEDLDFQNHLAHLRRTEVDYYTQPGGETSVRLIEKTAESSMIGGLKSFGEIQVTSQITGFRKIRWYTHENLGQEPLNLPPSELLTTGYWLALSDETVASLDADGLWTNNPNEYGSSWKKQRDLARSRDSFHCQVCGAPEEGRPHDVHHKTPFRLFASADQANQLANLITLCPSCHRRAELAVRVCSGLAGVAYSLGNLAPLFLMCDPKDIGVHSDPHAAIAEDKPAIVIYDQVPAGIGFSERLFEMHADLIQRALELVASCLCTDGCPSCVGPGGENGSGGKREALALLRTLSQSK
jgi:DEAD/DEAH box helicase domain-containing protein